MTGVTDNPEISLDCSKKQPGMPMLAKLNGRSGSPLKFVSLTPNAMPANIVGAFVINAPAVVTTIGLDVGEKANAGIPQPEP